MRHSHSRADHKLDLSAGNGKEKLVAPECWSCSIEEVDVVSRGPETKPVVLSEYIEAARQEETDD